MADTVKSFIEKQSKRDLFISSKIDEIYIEPIVKAWKEYGIETSSYSAWYGSWV